MIENSLALVLQIKSTTFDLHQITEIMGFEPEVSHGVGDLIGGSGRVSKVNYFCCSTSGFPSLDVNEHWRKMSSMMPSPDVFRAFKVQANVEFYVSGSFTSMSPIIEFSNASLTEIVGFGLDIGYDVVDLRT